MNWNIRTAIRTSLLANAPIYALVGEYISATFAPAATPAGAVWIAFSLITGQEEGAMDGDNGLTHPVFQFTVGGPDKEKIDAVCLLLQNLNCTQYVYVDPASISHTITFYHRAARDGWEENARVYKGSVDLEVWGNK